MEYVMNLLQNRITEYKALSFIFYFLRGLTKLLGFSSPAFFILYFHGVSFWLCLVMTIVFVGLMRIAWVQCDAKSRVYGVVHTRLSKRKEEVLRENFK